MSLATIITERSVSFDDIVGYEEAKTCLRGTIAVLCKSCEQDTSMMKNGQPLFVLLYGVSASGVFLSFIPSTSDSLYSCLAMVKPI